MKNILNYNNKRFRLVKVGGKDREREYTLIFFKGKKKEGKQASKQTSKHSHAKEWKQIYLAG